MFASRQASSGPHSLDSGPRTCDSSFAARGRSLGRSVILRTPSPAPSVPQRPAACPPAQARRRRPMEVLRGPKARVRRSAMTVAVSVVRKPTRLRGWQRHGRSRQALHGYAGRGGNAPLTKTCSPSASCSSTSTRRLLDTSSGPLERRSRTRARRPRIGFTHAPAHGGWRRPFQLTTSGHTGAGSQALHSHAQVECQQRPLQNLQLTPPTIGPVEVSAPPLIPPYFGRSGR